MDAETAATRTTLLIATGEVSTVAQLLEQHPHALLQVLRREPQSAPVLVRALRRATGLRPTEAQDWWPVPTAARHLVDAGLARYHREPSSWEHEWSAGDSDFEYGPWPPLADLWRKSHG